MTVPLHRRRTHPQFVEGCKGCHYSTLHIAHSSEWSVFKEKEAVLSSDLDAYKRLKQDGLQPEAVTGAANVERTATHRLDVEQRSNPFIGRMDDAQKDVYTALTAGGAA